MKRMGCRERERERPHFFFSCSYDRASSFRAFFVFCFSLLRKGYRALFLLFFTFRKKGFSNLLPFLSFFLYLLEGPLSPLMDALICARLFRPFYPSPFSSSLLHSALFLDQTMLLSLSLVLFLSQFRCCRFSSKHTKRVIRFSPAVGIVW